MAPGDRLRPGERRAALGRRGEELAAAHLEGHGFRIVARNWTGRTGELDLVVARGEVLAFVEVRTLEDADFDDPLASIGPRKIRQVSRAAQEYLLRCPAGPEYDVLRFDVVGVTVGAGVPKIVHIEDAFELPG